MRIHSNLLETSDIYKATSQLPGVYATVSEHGSRTHKAAFEVSLEGNGYRRNSGFYGASDEIGATWDEWGAFISAVYEVDPNAIFGSVKYPTYRHGYHFHEVTEDRFETPGILPEDTHKRHNWKAAGMRRQECNKCSAVRVYLS